VEHPWPGASSKSSSSQLHLVQALLLPIMRVALGFTFTHSFSNVFIPLSDDVIVVVERSLLPHFVFMFVRASPQQNWKQLLSVKMEYCLMITWPHPQMS
jgi:hypothetical protein